MTKQKHNKKRNTAFLYEALVREMTKAVVSKDKGRKDKVVDILGGRHRVFAAFLKGSNIDQGGEIIFNPTKIKAYVGRNR